MRARAAGRRPHPESRLATFCRRRAAPRPAAPRAQDRFDAPYGQNRGGNGDPPQDVGKPTHLKATVAAVQDGGLALVLNDLTMAIESTSHGGQFSSIAANVMLPCGAGVDGVYVDGRRLANFSLSAPRVALPLGATVAVRSAGGVAAFRIPFADGLAGYTPTSALIFDGPAGHAPAARLAVYLYQGPNTTFAASPPPSRSLLVIGVGDADDDAGAARVSAALAALVVTNDAANASDWRVTVAPPAGGAAPYPGFASTLQAAMWVPNEKLILARKVNGTALHLPPPGTLDVTWSDGKHLALTTKDF